MSYPVCIVTAKLRDFLVSKIKNLGTPTTVNYKWLASIGFKSTNDRSLITVLKFINFIDSSSHPTDLWKKFKGDNKGALAEGILVGYKDLYATYPEAHKVSTSDLQNYFRTHTDAGDRAIQSMVATFKTLSELADFERTSLSLVKNQPATLPEVVSSSPIIHQATGETASAKAPSVHIDIQIHIDANAKAEQIDQIFASMAKHLYDKQ